MNKELHHYRCMTKLHLWIGKPHYQQQVGSCVTLCHKSAGIRQSNRFLWLYVSIFYSNSKVSIIDIEVETVFFVNISRSYNHEKMHHWRRTVRNGFWTSGDIDCTVWCEEFCWIKDVACMEHRGFFMNLWLHLFWKCVVYCPYKKLRPRYFKKQGSLTMIEILLWRLIARCTCIKAKNDYRQRV